MLWLKLGEFSSYRKTSNLLNTGAEIPSITHVNAVRLGARKSYITDKQPPGCTVCHGLNFWSGNNSWVSHQLLSREIRYVIAGFKLNTWALKIKSDVDDIFQTIVLM